MAKRIGFMPSFGAIEDWPAYLAWYKIRGIDYEKRFDMNNLISTIAGPCTIIWFLTHRLVSGTYYLSEEENYKLTDLRTVIHPYIEEQVAKFITGARPLDEIDAFAEELKGWDRGSFGNLQNNLWSIIPKTRPLNNRHIAGGRVNAKPCPLSIRGAGVGKQESIAGRVF